MIYCKREDCAYHRGDAFTCHAPNLVLDEDGICRRYDKAKIRIMAKCPFCSGNPELKIVGDRKQFMVYSCSKCGKTPVPPSGACSTEEGAAKFWNEAVEKLMKND